MLKPFSSLTSTVSLPWMTSKWLDLTLPQLLSSFAFCRTCYSFMGFFPSLPVLIASVLSPSLIVAVTRNQRYLDSRANCPQWGIQFAQDAVVWFYSQIPMSSLPWIVVAGEVQCFQQSAGSWRVMVVWGITKMEVKWLSSTKAAGPWDWMFIKNMSPGNHHLNVMLFSKAAYSPWNIWARLHL